MDMLSHWINIRNMSNLEMKLSHFIDSSSLEMKIKHSSRRILNSGNT